jgi:hypothetical protein
VVDPVAAKPETSPARLHRKMLRIVGTDASLLVRTAVDSASEAEVVAELAA